MLKFAYVDLCNVCFAYNVHYDIVYFLSLHRSLLTMEPVTKKMRKSGIVDDK